MPEGGPKVAEVSFSPVAKLVMIRAGDGLFLRLRTLNEGEWSFATPPLKIEEVDALGLAGMPDPDRPDAVRLGVPGAELNLLSKGGRLYAHFERSQMSATAASFREALAKVSSD